jgi:hypothetical protein
MDNISYLEEGLAELKRFKAFLKSKGRLDWTKKLSKSITSLLPEIEKIVDNNKEEVLIINFKIQGDENIVIEYDNNNPEICFSLKFKRIEIGGFNRNKDGTLKSTKVLGAALFEFRDYVEKVLNYNEDKWLKEYEE